MLFVPVVIGRSNCFDFGFENRSKRNDKPHLKSMFITAIWPTFNIANNQEVPFLARKFFFAHENETVMAIHMNNHYDIVRNYDISKFITSF